jgi:hypothetical protein
VEEANVGDNARWRVFAECVAARSIQSGLPDALEKALRMAGLLAPVGDAVSCNAGPVIEAELIVSAEGPTEAEEDAVQILAAALRGCGADPDTYELTAKAVSEPHAISMFSSLE